jgi:cysteine desulfuration protein SufE
VNLAEKKEFQILELLQSLEQLEVYEYLVDLAKTLPKIPTRFLTQKYKIEKCSSRVWLAVELENEKIQLYAQSDSLIIKGILAILWQIYNDLDLKTAQKFQLSLFEKIDFTKFLTANRRSGLSGILESLHGQIKSLTQN